MPALDPSHFYKHSGRTGFSIPLILMLGIPASIVLAIVYAYVVVYCPVVGYVNVLFLGGYVLGTGFAISKLGNVGKCRNGIVLFVLGSLAGLIGLYFSWVFFFKALGGEQVSVLAISLQPAAFWQAIVELNAEGWWGPSGYFQWALCAIEALAFVIGVGIVASASIDREVFCEDCGSWCKKSNERNLKVADEYNKQLEKDGEFNHIDILKLPEAESNELPRFNAEILTCTGCQQTNGIRIKLLSAVVDKDGDASEETTDVPGILLQRSTA